MVESKLDEFILVSIQNKQNKKTNINQIPVILHNMYLEKEKNEHKCQITK